MSREEKARKKHNRYFRWMVQLVQFKHNSDAQNFQSFDLPLDFFFVDFFCHISKCRPEPHSNRHFHATNYFHAHIDRPNRSKRSACVEVCWWKFNSSVESMKHCASMCVCSYIFNRFEVVFLYVWLEMRSRGREKANGEREKPWKITRLERKHCKRHTIDWNG